MRLVETVKTSLATLKHLRKSNAASVVLTFAICAPALFGTVAAAVDYARMITARTELQQAVDSAALLGANELVVATMTDEQIRSSATAFVSAMESSSHPGVASQAAIQGNRTGIRVNATITLPLVLAPILGLNWQNLSATAAASLLGETQLCVLTLDGASAGSFGLSASARLTAPQCSAYANSNNPQGLQAIGSSLLTSSRTCTVGGFGGNSANFAPMPKTGCPTHSDPLAAVIPPAVNLSGCQGMNPINTTTILSPGTYCGNITINGSANVTLSPGVYVINNGSFHITGTAQVHGTNVALYFNGTGTTGTFKADPMTTVDLAAPATGPLAGFLMYQDATATPGGDFHISSINAHNLLGTIYLPQGNLTVDAAGTVAESSAYTVIVAQKLFVLGQANLTLNAMYSSTDVPVPKGVGPSGGTIALTQ